MGHRSVRIHLKRLLAVLGLLALIAVAGVALSQTDDAPSDTGNGAVRPETEPEVSGEAVYSRHCSVCHGETGLGLEEARDAFPDDHRRCTRCHRPGNPPTMSYAQVEARQHNLFDIGTPPPVRGDDSMAAHSGRDSLRQYVAATMPRWNPGSLSSAEYAAVTEFLLELND